MKLTHQQCLHREKDIQDELERLKGKKDKTADDHAAVPKLLDEFREVHAHRLDLEHDAALDEIRSATTTEAPSAEGGEQRDAAVVDADAGVRFGAQVGSMGKHRNPWDTSNIRYDGSGNRGELRSRALSCIEQMPHADDKVREVATKFVERGGSTVVDMVLASSSPSYTEAFAKVLRHKGQMAALSTEEQRLIARAMSLTDNAGGYLVPFQLDPSVILTANGSVNQVRQIARVVQATGDVWNGVTSSGVTASWDAEAAQVSDDSPTLGSPSIPVYKGQAFVQASYEVTADAPTLANEVATMVAFEKDRLESVAFVTGSGSGEPTGIITALTGGSSVLPSATTDTFALADVYALDAALPARFAANGSWLAHRAIYNKMRQFDTGGGNGLWGQLGDGRKTELLGRPDYVAEAMDNSITALSDNLVLLFGDFQNFVIADRLGATMRYIPDLFGANGRPTGQSGWLTYWRVGSDSVNDAAFRILNVT
ncbi:MAG: phage major capsid protein [Actinomycetota bacterium]|nr:phage major capsid protein [Actinomycetota bacterium]